MVCGLVWLQEQIPKNYVFKENRVHAKNTITILGPIVNISGGTYVIVNEHESLTFEIE